FSCAVAPIAVQDGLMQRDYWYAVGRKLNRLDSPEAVGQEAGRRTVRRLGARKIATCRVPVVFEPEIAGSFLGNLCSAVNGYAIYKGTSYLVGRLGERIAPDLVTVCDDGRMPGDLGSKPFDGEGLPTRKNVVVERGVLKSYLLDTYAARKLGLASTGNASRSIGEASSVGATNFYLAPGTATPEEIIRSVQRGLYVTELIGFGINMVTGDYSRGAVGFWIENGELAYPVEEITIAGNLKDMWMGVQAIGNDLVFRGRIASPTVKIAEMTVAGEQRDPGHLHQTWVPEGRSGDDRQPRHLGQGPVGAIHDAGGAGDPRGVLRQSRDGRLFDGRGLRRGRNRAAVAVPGDGRCPD